jgi:hypothetical protein
MQILLAGLANLQENPPEITFLLDGRFITKKVHLPIMMVMGDQKSQNIIVGQKASNQGG